MLSFAQYEVYKAITIEDDSQQTIKQQEEVLTFNDTELPNRTNENLVTFFGKKAIEKLKERKNKKNIIQKNNNEEIETTIKEENINSDNIIPTKTNETNSANETINDNNKFHLNANTISYDEENGNLHAQGNVEIIAKSQGVVLKADDVNYDKTSQTIKLNGNVTVNKSGTEMRGESLVVDLNEQNILMDNPEMNAYSFVINAQEGYLIANDIQAVNGTIKSNRNQHYVLETAGFAKYNNITKSKNDALNYIDFGKADRKQSYRIDAKEIVLNSYKDHNSIVLKKSNIYYNNHKIINHTDIEIIADKQNQVFETNLPELGLLRDFGTYFGYGHAFRMPKGQTLKVMPAITYGDSKLGVGIIGRYLTPNARIDAGYSTSTQRPVVYGVYSLTDSLKFRYGRCAYINEGFYGRRRSGYGAQLEYMKSYRNEDLDLTFDHGIYAGFYSDYRDKHQNLEKAYSTTRFRYLAGITKTIAKYENKEQDFEARLDAIVQGGATLYGSGQTTAIARVGPIITTKFKHWESNIGYIYSGEHGDSPFYFDKYMYGRSTIIANEKLIINDKFAIGCRAFITPEKDNWKNKLITESSLYAVIGPEDLKFVISYDFVRSNANVNIMLLLGSESTRINFERLITNSTNSTSKRDFYKTAKTESVDI